jgi:hypothetical protein
LQTQSNARHWRAYAALLLIVVVVVSTQLVASNYFRAMYLPQSHSRVSPGSGGGPKTGTTSSSSGGPTYLNVNTLINYGNGSSVWYNKTDVPIGSNFYNLTVRLANVQSEFYSGSLNEHEIQVINGFPANPGSSALYWSLWEFCKVDRAWEYAPVGADDILLNNGDILSWYFSDSSTVPPVSGANTVSPCPS